MIHLPTRKCSRGSNDTVKLYTDTQAMYERGGDVCSVRQENYALLPLHFCEGVCRMKLQLYRIDHDSSTYLLYQN